MPLKILRAFYFAKITNWTTATAPDRKTNVQKLKAYKDSFFSIKRHKWSDFADKNSYNKTYKRKQLISFINNFKLKNAKF